MFEVELKGLGGARIVFDDERAMDEQIAPWGIILIDDSRCKRIKCSRGWKITAGDPPNEGDSASGRGSCAEYRTDSGHAHAGGDRRAEAVPAVGDAV
jgi:hypothetical protein